MSLNDGKLLRPDLYITSDIALAAYLLLNGYELLGAIDTGTKRKEFGLTHTDPNVLANMDVDIQHKAWEFEGNDCKVFYRQIKTLHHSLDEPIKKEDL